ncbi:Putative uridine nucleosidase 2 [Chelonia mydas]|uniref:Putative uridine nucleosidase 2 n=1 Tax=Chelonia mydas TaxID=8469 RepID=M7BA83_CHEMY|nr:Putative uridine nucleosidase 2 [Chelonia mydas]
MTKLLLIDVDCGVDDAQAIMMALASPSVEILGITCCYGNTQLENVCKNVLRVLQVCNRLEEFYHELVNQDTKKAKFMEKISAHSIKFTDSKHENTGNMLWTSGFVSCDSYAMAAAIDESFVTKAIEVAVSVELNGSLTRGMMVMDMISLLKKKNKAFVINKCDLEKFKGLLIAALK